MAALLRRLLGSCCGFDIAVMVGAAGAATLWPSIAHRSVAGIVLGGFYLLSATFVSGVETGRLAAARRRLP
ncbi:MAG: hypothetical protein KGK07_07445 [Chloroflexota bacterium]|nr:hypothetical protein [Chloroflexota bacterium]